jgi:hypothetical protein
MKRNSIIIGLVILVLLSITVFADESVLIDFSKLSENSFKIEDIRVDLGTSSRSVLNDAQSFTRVATSKQYGTILGARVHFPTWPNNSYSVIRPPFEIPAYSDKDENQYENQLGVITNVGTIKSIAINVYGLNFPYRLSLLLIGPNGPLDPIHIGYLNFEGWKELVWENPSYVQDVKNRELHLNPLYPNATPFLKFGGFIIHRDGSAVGGDFVTYFKDIKVIYDKAVLDTERDIDDESTWGIIRDRENERRVREQERFVNDKELREKEQQKIAKETEFSKSE